MGQMNPSLHRQYLTAGVLLACIALTTPVVFAQDFSKMGPYSYKWFGSWFSPLPLGWHVQVTWPTNKTGSPFPLVVMFNGFQCQASWYSQTVRHLVSWGYVVAQYTSQPFYSFSYGESDEVQYLATLLEWLEKGAHEWNGQVDFSRKAVMGHSRGGKLASLHYASRSDLATAVLIDPVDCSSEATGESHPSAIAKLATGMDIACSNSTPAYSRSQRSAAIIGSGHVLPWWWKLPSCTPNGNNASAFSAVVSTSSWYIQVKEAGHMQFAESWNPITYGALNNAVCGHGNIMGEAVILEAKTMAVAWFESVFRPSQDSTKVGLEAFKKHLQEQSAKGILTYSLPDTSTEETLVAAAGGGSADTSEL